MFREVVFACALLLGVTVVYGEDDAAVNLKASVNCSDTYSLFNAMQDCMDMNNINATMPDPALFVNGSTVQIITKMQQLSPNQQHCRPENIENYINASLCLNNVYKSCFGGDADSLRLPSNNETRQWTLTSCQQILSGEFNADCVLAKVGEILDCANTSGISTGFTINNFTAIQYILEQQSCAVERLTFECTRMRMKSCGEGAVQMYLQRRKQIVPDPCMNTDQEVVDLSPLVTCSEPSSVSSAKQKCIDLYNLTSILPDWTLITMARGLDSKTTAELCKTENIENYINGTRCMYHITKKCTNGNPVVSAGVASNSQVRQQIQLSCQQNLGTHPNGGRGFLWNTV